MILITGGTGTLGHAIVEQHYQKEPIVIFSRDEYKQWEMKKKYPDCFYEIGDVRDRERVNNLIYKYSSILYGLDTSEVIHAAALKHVNTAEEFPHEAYTTNVQGTKNVVDACNDYDVRMVLVSTDKACQPINTYGATKMIAEQYTITQGQRVVRYGNVFGSRGSVLHVFKKMYEKGGKFPITDMRMSRFIITVSNAVRWVFEALNADPGTVTIPDDLKAIDIIDLCYAFDPKATIYEIGIQPGEKLAEILDREGTISSATSPRYTIEEIQELIDECS